MSVDFFSVGFPPGEPTDAPTQQLPAEVAAHFAALSDPEVLGPGDWPIQRGGWEALLTVGSAFHATPDNLPRKADLTILDRTVNSENQDHETRTIMLQDRAWGVTALEVVAWRHALLAGSDGYNALQPLAVRLAHVQAIASWKATGRGLADLDPSSREATWLRLGVALDDIGSWESAGVDLQQPGLAAFVAERGGPRYAVRLEQIWRDAVAAGHATGDVETFRLGFMMLFVDAAPAALERYLQACAPRAVTSDEAIAFFRGFLAYQDDRGQEEADAAEQGLTVTEMRMRHAWQDTHEVPGITAATHDLYREAGVAPWEITLWEGHFRDADPRLREFVLRHVATLRRRATTSHPEHRLPRTQAPADEPAF